MNSSRSFWLGAFGATFLAVLLYMLVGHHRQSFWPANAVHNWEQYGLSALHGKLTVNPGGFDALNNPEYYKGHRAAGYYPIYAVSKLASGWMNGLLAFHAVFTFVVFFTIWHLMGRNALGAVGGMAAALCPGYAIYPTVVDPNAVALYMTIPFAAVAIHFLSAKELTPGRLAILAVATFLYSSLNWTTAFGHGILFCALLVLPSVPWARLGIYLLMAGASVGVVGLMSVLDKMSGNGPTSSSGGFGRFLAGYTWGHVGYGADLTTIKAIVRLVTVNTLGLLPLMALLGWLALKIRRADRRWDTFAFLPIIAAAGGVMVLRNYFGHHPWMAAPMLIPGLVLSLCLLLQRREAGAPELPCQNPAAGLSFLLTALLFAVGVTGAHRAYGDESLEMVSFVIDHTMRADTIALAENLNPEMCEQAISIAHACDRHVIVLATPQTTPTDVTGNLFLLTNADLSGQLTAVGRSGKSAFMSLPGIREMSAWYAEKIARRGAQDHHFDYTTKATFGLYRLPAANP
jgi:hypothetical protein